VGFVVKASVAVISAGLSIFLVGCSKQERMDVIGFIKNRLGGK
jgi:hypothetical protein